MHPTFFRLTFYFAALILLLASCRQVKKVFTSESPREEYAKAMKEGPLAENKIVQDWLAAGDSVINDPVPMELPIQTKVIYFSDEANAWAWQFSLQEGRTVRAKIAQADSSHQIFMDLYALENDETVLEKSANDSLISYTLDEDQTLILRVQPELLINGSATITITDNPSMKFPVAGGRRADIGSFWGDPRDAGRRKHKGVDIFADRGTPVVASAGGRVTRTGNGGLGGKTVWLRAGGKSLYYAHLDSINSGFGQGVEAGDTLGFVGNTGNARTTPPHLHFGIYDRGATNPLPFIDFANNQPEPVLADPSTFLKWGRINAPKANVRPLPSTQKEPIASLERNNPVKILGGTGEWYQVKLPDGRRGFIFQSLVSSAASPLKKISTNEGDSLFYDFSFDQPFLTFKNATSLDIYADYKNQKLVKFNNHWFWVNE